MSQPRILMYVTGWCPFCQRARTLLGLKNLNFEEIDVESDSRLREEMTARAGRSTVPQIFIGETHVGGFDDLDTLDRDGGLDRLLEDAQ